MSAAAWFCPSCQKHHAPHCDTCPGGGVKIGIVPFGAAGVKYEHRDCECPVGQPCGNSACPRALKATYGYGPKLMAGPHIAAARASITNEMARARS
jgi:hypothetical protein